MMGVLFAKKCVLCGCALELGGKAVLCPSCAGEVRRAYRCTEAVSIPGADGAAAALYYKGNVRQAMHRFKFGGAQSMAEWFAAQTVPLLAAHLEDWRPDLVTFMPIGPLHYRKRGYNQAELLAKPIAAALSLPCAPTLRKRLFSQTQSEQNDRDARLKNAEHSVLPKSGVDLTEKSVVLVDDIITTGATATAAVRVLREMGAARVYVLAPTKTPLGS